VTGRSRFDALAEDTVRIPANQTMGFELQPSQDPKQRITFTWTVPADYCNSTGGVQGGILAAFADAVLGAATAAHLPDDHYPALAEMKISIYRPAPAGTKLTGEGQVLKAGRRVIFAEAEITDNAGKLIAKASATEIPAQAPD
jgi:uncharacterized protein (TIGR00369 family)